MDALAYLRVSTEELAHGMIKEIIAVSRSEIKVVLKIAD